MYECIIIGGGPSGLTAAIYLARGGIKTLLLERAYPGGQISLTNELENYPGFDNPIGGMEFAMKLENQAKKFGAEIKYEEVTKISTSGNTKTVRTNKGKYEAKTIIIATGAEPRKLSVPGEDRLMASGVSYCATCDGMFFKGGDVVVVGGGDSAAEDTIYLSRFCRKVYMVHRRDKLRASRVLSEKLKRLPNVKIIWNTVIKEIHGNNKVESVTLENSRDKSIMNMDVDAVFIAIGYKPNNELVKDLARLSPEGYILADNDLKIAAADGIFVAGDVRAKNLRQVVTACADGANAAGSVMEYLNAY